MTGRRTRKVPCGATTRAGHPCRRLVPPGKRCTNHGGASTGPKTPSGKGKAALNLPRVRAAYAAREEDLATLSDESEE